MGVIQSKISNNFYCIEMTTAQWNVCRQLPMTRRVYVGVIGRRRRAMAPPRLRRLLLFPPALTLLTLTLSDLSAKLRPSSTCLRPTQPSRCRSRTLCLPCACQPLLLQLPLLPRHPAHVPPAFSRQGPLGPPLIAPRRLRRRRRHHLHLSQPSPRFLLYARRLRTM